MIVAKNMSFLPPKCTATRIREIGVHIIGKSAEKKYVYVYMYMCVSHKKY
jgi:hypothetical protein